MRPIVIAAGGTGGHFFPAEALAAALIARGHRVVLMTDARTGARLGPVFSGGEHHVLHGAGLAGRGAARAARATLSLGYGVLQARRILSRIDASVVVGFGGYPSVPPVLAARLVRRRPAIVLHEQNAVLGRANRFLSRHADVLALGFADTSHVPAGVRARVTGNPVRPAIRALAGTGYAPPGGLAHLLVIGGSLGARVFGDVVPGAVAELDGSIRARLHVVQQCRAEDLGRAQAAYAACGVTAELAPFFTDMADRIAASHIVVSRAGASSCAEIAVAGRPAILVPLPGAIDDHQAANARAVDGACVIPQADFTVSRLSAELAAMLGDPAALVASAARIAACGRAASADDLADAVEGAIARAEARP